MQEFLNKVPTFRDLFPLRKRSSTTCYSIRQPRESSPPQHSSVGQFVLLLEAAAKLKGVLDGFAGDEVNARLQAGQDGFIGPPAPKDPRSLRERLGLDEDDGSGSGTGNGAEFEAKRVRDGIRAGELADRENEARRIAIRNQDQLLERLTAQLRVQNPKPTKTDWPISWHWINWKSARTSRTELKVPMLP